MRPSFLLLTLMLALGALSSCKTTEADYRSAYEKTIAGRDSSRSLEETVYGNMRRLLTEHSATLPDGTEITYRSQPVRVTKDGGAIAENLRRYNIVVGQFKQLFNARSLRNRLVDAGHSGAFVVETGEPYYFVVIRSFSELKPAADALQEIRSNPPVQMKEPLPFILDATSRRSGRN